MAINYKIAKRAQAGVKGGGTPKYQAIVTGRKSVSTYELSKMISSRCTLQISDVGAVLLELSELLPKLLCDGYSVQLDKVGIFSATLKSELRDTPEEVGLKSIKELRVQFRADGEFKMGLGMYDLHRVNG
jgi:predicted histone-like DNA-binding protein